MKHTLYCGSYGNEGIYKVEEENGIFSEPQLFSKISGTKYLCVDQDRIVSLYSEGKGKSGVAVLDIQGNKLASLIYEDILSCSRHLLKRQAAYRRTAYNHKWLR